MSVWSTNCKQEETVIISLNSKNQLLFVMEFLKVYCLVGTQIFDCVCVCVCVFM